jgi:hypothetical protein
LAALDPGERTALRLAEQLRSDVILLDESAARALARRPGPSPQNQFSRFTRIVEVALHALRRTACD